MDDDPDDDDDGMDDGTTTVEAGHSSTPLAQAQVAAQVPTLKRVEIDRSTLLVPFNKKWATAEFLTMRPMIEGLVVQVSEIMAKATMLVRIWAVAIAREAREECDQTFRIKFDRTLLENTLHAVQGTAPDDSATNIQFAALQQWVELSRDESSVEPLFALRFTRPRPRENPLGEERVGSILRRALAYAVRDHVAHIKRHLGDYHRMVREFVNKTLAGWLSDSDEGEGDAKERKRWRADQMRTLKAALFCGTRDRRLERRSQGILRWCEAHFELVLPRQAGTGDRLPEEGYAGRLSVLLNYFPEQALRPLLYMASFLGQAGESTFEVLPQRNDFTPGPVLIDTALLTQLLVMGSKERWNKAEKVRSDETRKLWKRVLTRRALETGSEGTMFAHTVRTDGYSIHIARATSRGLGKKESDSDKRAEGVRGWFSSTANLADEQKSAERDKAHAATARRGAAKQTERMAEKERQKQRGELPRQPAPELPMLYVGMLSGMDPLIALSGECIYI
ncbi:hypothetical protein B484DRAFT_463070 [Ochromonadaceae sp. CCMP2298]|nr:hypothetical protein B484DRAFT_463070 [Ochromonadaceae sp. CCMP2298]